MEPLQDESQTAEQYRLGILHKRLPLRYRHFWSRMEAERWSDIA